MMEYEEMARRVLQRRDEYLVQQRRHRRTMAASAAGVGLAAALGFSIWRPWTVNTPAPAPDPLTSTMNDTAKEIKSAITEQKEQKKDYASTERSDKLIVNEISGAGTADMDVEIDILSNTADDSWQKTAESFKSFMGFSYESFEQRLAPICEIDNFHSLSTKKNTDSQVSGEYTIHDYVFGCRTKSGGKVVIAISPIELPLRCALLMTNDEPVISQVFGVPMEVYGDGRVYYTRFELNGVYYDIEADSIGIEELEALLLSIVVPEPADAPADEHGAYHELPAADPTNAYDQLADIYGGSYTDNAGSFTVLLTENTPENRELVCKALGISLNNTLFESCEYSYEYLTELQSRISEHMASHKLPKLASSSLRDDANRIIVTLASAKCGEDLDDLSPLLSLDTMGGAIVIEGVSGEVSTEVLLLP